MKLNFHLTLICALVSLMLFKTSFAQTPKSKPQQRSLLHYETQDDPYLPNEFNNTKTSAPYKVEDTRSVSKTMNSTIFTSQANVNGSGQNIIGDAANEPSIAVNPVNPNEMSIGWRQFDNVNSNFRQAGYAYTTDAGQTWTFPGVIQPGWFRSDPVLDYDDAGNFYYNSLTNNPDYFCKVFESSDGGATWNSGTDAGGGDKQWMTIDRTSGPGNGNIYSSWNSFFTTCAPGFFTRSTNGNNSYENCTEVDGYPFWNTMAVGNSGELYIAGANDLNNDIVFAKSLNAQIPASIVTWDPPVYIFMDGYADGWTNVNPAGLLGQINIDVDRSSGPGQDNIYVAASLHRSSSFDDGDVMFSRSTDGGLTWDSPVKINDDASTFNTQWFAAMAVAPTGRIDVVWLDTREDQSGADSSALYYSYSIDQGVTWSANEKMSDLFDPHIGYPNQDKMGDYFDIISDSTSAHVAWVGTFNGEQDVYYSNIIPPVSTGLQTPSSHSNVSIFPNPSNGNFNITGITSKTELEVYNLLGTVIYTSILSESKNSLNIDCSSGIYFVKLKSSDGNLSVHKLIVE